MSDREITWGVSWWIDSSGKRHEVNDTTVTSMRELLFESPVRCPGFDAAEDSGLLRAYSIEPICASCGERILLLHQPCKVGATFCFARP